MTTLTGTGTLIRFILRRDRWRLPIWILGIVGFFLLVAASFPSIYPTDQERQARARLMENPTALAFRGPGHGMEDYTYGAMLAHELMGYAAIATALMSIFLVVRHTRTEEESGRLELVRAAVVGRDAPPVAAVTIVIMANLTIAALFAGLLQVVPGDYSLAGSLAFGMSIASVGIVFAAVAAVTAQLSESGRGASSMAALVLGATYLLRAIGDVQENALSWLSPVGWAQATRPFVDERLWPLTLPVLATVVLLGAVFVLISRRDVTAGILPSRPGPARASRTLTTPVGFALRQQRGGLIGWLIGIAVVGMAFGSLVGDVEAFIEDNPQLEDVLRMAEGVSLVESFLGFLILVLSFLVTGFAIQAALRARSEENEGRAEPLLSTALSRVRWLGSYLIVSLLGSGLILIAGAASLGGTAALDQRDPGLLWGSLGAAAALIPAMWVAAGLGALLFGFLPRLLFVPWLLLIYGAFIGLFGEMVQAPGWMFDVSPWEHAPDWPGIAFLTLSTALTLVLALIIIGGGLYGFRNRDLDTA